MLLKDLFEAMGVFNRQPGQQVMHTDTGHVLTFVEVRAFPEDSPAFDSAEDRDAFIVELEKSLPTAIQWTNQPNSGMKAFGLAFLVDNENNDQAIFGRYFNQVRQTGIPATWNSKDFNNYQLQTQASKKNVAGFMPQDIIGIERKEYNSVAEIMKTIEASLKDKPEVVAGFRQLANGQLPTFVGQREHEAAIRDYAGEVMQPIALMTKLILGEADDARKLLFGPGTEWADCKVYWPPEKNYNLIDSVFEAPNKQTIGISSKGKKGADASIKNISDAIENAKTANPELVKQYQRVVDIIELLNTHTAKDGPPLLCEKLGILSNAEVLYMSSLDPATTNVTTTIEQISQAGHTGLVTIYNAYGANFDHQNYNIYMHLLANCAKYAANMLNEDLEFGNGMLQFMNQASIVQIYTNTGHKDDDCYVSGFRSVYPPRFSGRIILNGSKNYASTKVFGKIAFTYK